MIKLRVAASKVDFNVNKSCFILSAENGCGVLGDCVADMALDVGLNSLQIWKRQRQKKTRNFH
jgi:hypothetical protein